jgi:hypothetical protein
MAIVNGWLINGAQKATISAAAVTNPFFLNGSAYAGDGTRFVALFGGSVLATDVNRGGVLHNSAGAMYYITAVPTPIVFRSPFSCNQFGAVLIDSVGAVVTSINGLGFTATGALAETGV